MNTDFLRRASPTAAWALMAALGCATPDENAFYGSGRKDAAADGTTHPDADGAASCDPGKSLCGTACVDLASDLSNCGSCKNGCQIGQVCTKGSCVTGCAAPKIECSGVCVDSLSDNNNCGGCGVPCTGGSVCSAGTCAAACGAGLTKCSGVCVNLQSDNANCGECAKTCGAGTVCSQGACNLTCQTGLTDCQGTCVNLQTDNYHCGGCGAVCGSGKVCTSGVCAVSCQAGQTNCSGTCANLQTDNANCGTCSHACASGTACSGGTCVVTCSSGQTNCNGACANLQNDPDNCGGCGSVCSGQNMASRTCGAGQCNGACAAGWGDCDSNKQNNGCETSVTSQSNCGSCGHACTGSQTCQSGTCQSTCSNVNVAPQATVTISAGGSADPWVPARANDNVMQTSNCTDWCWIDTDDAPSGAWIEYQWTSARQIASIHMDTESSNTTSACGKIGRTLGAATIQWWNGSWVTDGQVSGRLDDWDYTFSAPVTTTRLRLYNVYAVGTSAFNPVVFEWQAFGCN